ALVTVVDGTSPYTYAWTGPNSFTASTALITGLAAGTYTCTVTDQNGCTTIQGALVKEPSDLTATISGTNILCNGNSSGTVSLTVDGGTTPYTYAWTGPNSFTASIKDLSNIKAGTYTVTISDKNQCSITKSITITEPLAPITTGIQKTDVKCYGGFTGAADLTVNGGTTPYTYAWTGPSLFTASTQDLTGIKFGTYNVTVTDQNGCTKTNTVTITQPLSPLAIDNIAVSDLTCFNNHTGSALVTVVDGTSPYTYAWTGPNSFTASTALITGLAAGTYTCTVTDQNGCTTTQASVVNQPNLLVATVIGTDILCNGSPTGAANVTVVGGTSPYTYAWTGPNSFSATTEDLSGLYAGTYEFTVTDVNGCQGTTIVTIHEPDLLTIEAIGSNVNCKYDKTGTATATALGGTGSDTFTWSTIPVQHTATATNLGIGTYTVTVTDVNGCQATTTATIGYDNEPPSLCLDGPREVCCDEPIPYTDYCQQNVDLTIPNTNYSWQWVIDGGHIVNGGNTCCPTIVWYCNCTIGWIKVLKTDLTTGCWIYDSISVIVHPKPVPVITGDTIVLTNANPVTYSVPCLPDQLYSWSVVGGTITGGQGSCTITVNWDWAACQDCPSSVCVTVTSLYTLQQYPTLGIPQQIGCDGSTCITVHQMPLPGSCKIFGQVLYDNIMQSVPMNGVTVKLLANGVVKATTVTATDLMEIAQIGLPGDPNYVPGDTTYVAGYYEFNNFDCSTASNTLTYTLQVSGVSQQTWGGVNATDALMIKNYTVGNITLAPLPKKAADPNLSTTVNATDALLVQLRTVGLVNSYAAGNWVYDFPILGNYSSSSLTPLNIMVLATGDVNKSLMPNIGYIADNYTTLQKEGVSIASNSEEILIPVRVNEALSLGAVTLDLAYMQNLIEVTGITSPLSGFEYKISNGVIKIAWANPNAVTLQANDILLTLKVKAKDVITATNDLFSWSNNRTEFADAYGNILSFSNLKVNGIQTDSRSNGISVYPNPFTNYAEVNYNLVEAGSVRIVLYNAVGQRIEVLVDENKTAGNYKYNLNTSALQSGVYSCEIIINGQTSNYQKVIKLVKTK
ncbi:MAG: T9SS type A sorting domain-containing protein, partial [Bacteroidetes bacterium]|nr:T9SS type A sorting domain-containing protein [Bacteroidota bacterium]